VLAMENLADLLGTAPEIAWNACATTSIHATDFCGHCWKIVTISQHHPFCSASAIECLQFMSRKHMTKHFRMAKKYADEQKLVSNSQSLCNIHWIYTAR